MKTTDEVLKETGLTYPMLNRLKDLGIVQKPKRKGLGRRKGVIGVFEDDVVDIINRVKLQQKAGLSLAQIAEELRREQASLKTVEPQNKVVIPNNPGALRSYIKAMPSFHKQMETENPGYEVYRVELESVEQGGKEFLIPVKVIMRPKR
jgi:DNA-binding transcriptional MerR regulator